MLKDAWFIAWKDVQYVLRERETLAWTFIMPIVFFYFIGTVTGGGLGFGTTSTPLAVQVPETAGFVADQLIKRLEDNQFAITRVSETAEEFPQLLIIPPDFSEAIQNGETMTVELISQEPGLTQDLEALKVTRAVYTLLADVIASQEDNTPLSPAVFEQLNTAPRALTLQVEAGGQRQEIPSGFDQAIPGTMVMFTLLVLLTSGAVTLFLERERGGSGSV